MKTNNTRNNLPVIRSFKYLLMMFLLSQLIMFNACGDKESDMREDKIKEDKKENTPENQRDIKTKNDNQAPKDVTVNLTDNRIEMPQGITSGTVNFHVKNSGAIPHNFEVEGLDVHEELGKLDPGESETLTVGLTPGVYKFHCSHEGHAPDEMTLTLSVQ